MNINKLIEALEEARQKQGGLTEVVYQDEDGRAHTINKVGSVLTRLNKNPIELNIALRP